MFKYNSPFCLFSVDNMFNRDIYCISFLSIFKLLSIHVWLGEKIVLIVLSSFRANTLILAYILNAIKGYIYYFLAILTSTTLKEEETTFPLHIVPSNDFQSFACYFPCIKDI